MNGGRACDIGSQQAAMVNQYREQFGGLGGLGGQIGSTSERQTIKDPTVSDAQDAIAALRKRLDVVKASLATMPRLQAEQARIERMLSAAAPDDP